MTGRTRPLARCTWVVGFCLIMASCTRSEEAASAGGTNQKAPSAPAGESPATSTQGLAIEFRSEPDPPKAGDNSVEVTVQQPDGSPVTDATVTSVFFMPAMPSMNMPAMRSTATLAHESAGRYRGTAQLSMGGTWNVTIMVSRGAQAIGRKSFSVVAK